MSGEPLSIYAAGRMDAPAEAVAAAGPRRANAEAATGARAASCRRGARRDAHSPRHD